MNFNLVSPANNGYEYTVRFQEPIDIPKNSTTSLNWTELTRDGKIVLQSAGTITISVDPSNVFPRKNPNAILFPDNQVFDAGVNSIKSATIAAGSYNFSQFATEIATALTCLLPTQ